MQGRFHAYESLFSDKQLLHSLNYNYVVSYASPEFGKIMQTKIEKSWPTHKEFFTIFVWNTGKFLSEVLIFAAELFWMSKQIKKIMYHVLPEHVFFLVLNS